MTRQWLMSPTADEVYLHFYLQTCSAAECAMTYLCSMPFERQATLVTQVPTPILIKVHSINCWPHLIIRTQGQFVIDINGISLHRKTPSPIQISFTQARKLRRIFNYKAEDNAQFDQFTPIMYRIGTNMTYHRLHPEMLPFRPDAMENTTFGPATTNRHVQQRTPLVASAPV